MNEWLVILPLLLGWLLDLVLGDPTWLPHPIVWFGKAIAFCEHHLNKGQHRKVKGALVAIGLIAITFAIGLIINCQLSIINFVIVFFCLAGTTLIREVREVFRAVDRSLEEGRRQVARIVGRDTSELSAQEIRTAALETLAENLSDGVIAPLFWLAILGVPGMLAYKMVNTLDSMIGYRTERYKDFGCWAAHIDDIANYIPARLTALLMIIGYRLLAISDWPKAKNQKLIAFVWRYGRNHASPNSGYPEAALAGILNCRFGGPHYYFGELFDKPYIGENDRELTTDDMKKAVLINRTAEVMMVILTGLCLWFI
jgi:adenosylcobinamide-phosphate synthase